ncbi:MAG: hypothetical protein R3F20_03045 [Planctomycetota bacterium]
MSEAKRIPHDTALKRLLIAQAALVAAGLVLVIVGYLIESYRGGGYSIGSFWFAFLCGGLGAAIALGRRLKQSPTLVEDIARTHLTLGIALMFGSLMATVTYLLFMSGVLSGEGGRGFVTSNLFPSFNQPEQEGVSPSLRTFVALRPETTRDVGKLLIWCFVAGYSEKFVTRILGQLEGTGAPASSK